MKKYKRSGDHYLHEITKEEFEKIKGEIVKHNGSFVFGVGEASNHNHTILVKDKENLVIKKDSTGRYYFALNDVGDIAHFVGDSKQVADHKTIPIEKKYYRQVYERELDLFSNVVRKVID